MTTKDIEFVPLRVTEYQTLLEELGTAPTDEAVRNALMAEAAWTDLGASALLQLAKRYGTFVLSNALALANALGIEDGEEGL